VFDDHIERPGTRGSGASCAARSARGEDEKRSEKGSANEQASVHVCEEGEGSKPTYLRPKSRGGKVITEEYLAESSLHDKVLSVHRTPQRRPE